MFEKLSWQIRLRRVISHLEEDRRDLLQGKTERLAARNLRRSEAEQELLQIPETMIPGYEREINRIKTLAKRNEVLLKAYIEGSRNASRRLGEIDREQSKIGAYARNGARIDPDRPKPTQDVRA